MGTVCGRFRAPFIHAIGRTVTHEQFLSVSNGLCRANFHTIAANTQTTVGAKICSTGSIDETTNSAHECAVGIAMAIYLNRIRGGILLITVQQFIAVDVFAVIFADELVARENNFVGGFGGIVREQPGARAGDLRRTFAKMVDFFAVDVAEKKANAHAISALVTIFGHVSTLKALQRLVEKIFRRVEMKVIHLLILTNI
jgi:hypothetical protein